MDRVWKWEWWKEERMKEWKKRNEEMREGLGKEKELEKCPLSSFYKRMDDKRRQRGREITKNAWPRPLLDNNEHSSIHQFSSVVFSGDLNTPQRFIVTWWHFLSASAFRKPAWTQCICTLISKILCLSYLYKVKKKKKVRCYLKKLNQDLNQGRSQGGGC